MPCILVVDDDAPMRLLLDASLRAAGYTVALAANGREALARLRAMPADLVLLDAQMPELNGIGTLAAMRADPALAAIPAILITAYPSPDLQDQALAAGCRGYLAKPVERKVLLREVASGLEARELPAPPAPQRQDIPN